MANPQIKVVQFPDRSSNDLRIESYHYKVVSAVNTTTPKLGEYISEARLNELVDMLGFTVSISEPK